MLGVLKKVFGTKNERELKKLLPLVKEINELEPEISALSSGDLRLKTESLRERALKAGEEFDSEIADIKGRIQESSPAERQKLRRRLRALRNRALDAFIAEAFAVVREAAKREIGMRHFDVQLMGAAVLHRGTIAEMATGEGKTLVATMPLYLNALAGRGAHLVTVNDYLARRDRHWMGPVYESLGLSVGLIQHDMAPADRKEAYGADITYGTNNEYGFDYLRDNMVVRKDHMVQRDLHFAIIDEVDSILIDEARTPLIISGPAEMSTDIYFKMSKIASKLVPGEDYEVEEKSHSVSVTEPGVAKAEKLLGVENLYSPENKHLIDHLVPALRARELFKKDVHYMIKDGQVVIVDEFTGRLMPGRRWSDGLHQAVEAKEGVKIERENQTLATITFQNYFKLYDKIAGMTGTAETEAGEFHEIYDLEVVVVPPNMKLHRISHPDVIYKTEEEKYSAVVDEVGNMNSEGRPVLVGTISIEKSERLSKELGRAGIAHNVLNARYHETEAEIVARAGAGGAVTIATNMAGRGTDIVLGEGVADKGGLHIIATERHEARRIDNQLRGRAGRQGDPGSSRFYLSLEDDLMRIFASDKISGIMDRVGWEKGAPLEHGWLTRIIESAQKKVESHNFDMRKQLLEFDNVMNQQREVIYNERRMVLLGEDLREHILGMLEETVEERVDLYLGQLHPEDWKKGELAESIKLLTGADISEEEIEERSNSEAEASEHIYAKLKELYDSREKELGGEVMRGLERAVMLQVIDTKWKEHLLVMDHLRDGIHLRAYGQKDPVVEYQKEGFVLFQELVRSIRDSIVEFMFKVRVSGEAPASMHKGFRGSEEFEEKGQFSGVSAGARPEAALPRGGAKREPVKRPEGKVGRNEPCPCGSGRKYKKCCGG